MQHLKGQLYGPLLCQTQQKMKQTLLAHPGSPFICTSGPHLPGTPQPQPSRTAPCRPSGGKLEGREVPSRLMCPISCLHGAQLALSAPFPQHNCSEQALQPLNGHLCRQSQGRSTQDADVAPRSPAPVPCSRSTTTQSLPLAASRGRTSSFLILMLTFMSKKPQTNNQQRREEAEAFPSSAVPSSFFSSYFAPFFLSSPTC